MKNRLPLMSREKVTLPNGIYNCRWGGYSLKITKNTEVATIDGVKGIDCAHKVMVIDGSVYEHSDHAAFVHFREYTLAEPEEIISNTCTAAEYVGCKVGWVYEVREYSDDEGSHNVMATFETIEEAEAFRVKQNKSYSVGMTPAVILANGEYGLIHGTSKFNRSWQTEPKTIEDYKKYIEYLENKIKESCPK